MMQAAFLAFLATDGICAAAVPHHVIHRLLLCGSFRVEATSDVAEPQLGLGEEVLSQTIRLINPSTHQMVVIGAPQHRSADGNLGGQDALDMPVNNMACIRLRTGEDVVTLSSECDNPDATTCPPAMDWRPEYGTPGRPHEDYWSYDAHGRLIYSTDPRKSTDVQYRHFTALGLFPDYLPDGVDLLR